MPAALRWNRCRIVGISADTLPPAMSTALCVSATAAIAIALPITGTATVVTFGLERAGTTWVVIMPCTLSGSPDGELTLA
jgi:hypothetical protein